MTKLMADYDEDLGDVDDVEDLGVVAKTRVMLLRLG